MKNIKCMIFGVFAVLFMTLNVNAKSVTTLDELRSCMSLENEETCEVTEKVVITDSDIEVVGTKTLIISDEIIAKAGVRIREGDDLTVRGNITVEDTRVLFFVYAGGSLNLESGEFISKYKAASSSVGANLVASQGSSEDTLLETNIIIGENAVLRNGGVAIYDNKNAAYGVVIDIKGKIYMGKDENTYQSVYINGNVQKTSGNVPKIYVRDTAVISNDGTAGLFIAGYGHIIVEGGTIEGTTGIEIRAGKLDVLNGTIVGSSEIFKAESNRSGSSVVGAGIAVSQHTTALPIDVNIKNGNISGKNAMYLGFLEENPNTEIVSVSVDGGTFNTNIEEFVSEGLVSKKIGDNYVVGKENEIKISTVSNGKVEVDKTKAIVGETVTLTVNPDEGYEVKTLKVVGTSNVDIPVNNNKFIMPNAEVNVIVEFNKITVTTDIPVLNPSDEVTELVIGVDKDEEISNILVDSLNNNETYKDLSKDTSVKVSLEIEKKEIAKEEETKIVDEAKKTYENIVVSEYFDISVVLRNSTNEKLGELTDLTKGIKLTVSLSKDLLDVEDGKSRNYYVIREHDGKIEYIKDVKLSEDGKSLIFTTDKFSTYAIAYEDVNVKNPQTGDNTLLYIALCGISIVGIYSAVNVIKKKKLFN